MANTFNTSSLVSKQIVQSLHAKGGFINTVDKSYSRDFTQKQYTPGTTVTIDIQHQPTITSGKVASVQNIVNRTTSVTLGQYNGAYKWGSLEKGYSEPQIRKYADGIALRLIREMEVTGLAHAAKTTGQSVGTPGTEPGALKTWSTARAKITNQLGPMRDYYAATSPLAMVELTDSLKNAVNPTAQISNQYLKGRMKNAMGLNFWESQSIYRLTAGTGDNTTPVVKGASQSGSTLKFDGNTSGDTFKAGTHFTIANVNAVDPETKTDLGYLQEFVITADATDDGTDVTVSISPAIYGPTSPHQNVSALPADNAAITLKNVDAAVSSANLVYDKDAFTLVSVPLPAAEKSGVHTFSNFEGIQIRVGFGAWDAINDDEILRVDAVWAWGTLRPEHACVVWGA